MSIYKSIKVTIFLVAGLILTFAPEKDYQNHYLDAANTTLESMPGSSKSQAL